MLSVGEKDRALLKPNSYHQKRQKLENRNFGESSSELVSVLFLTMLGDTDITAELSELRFLLWVASICSFLGLWADSKRRLAKEL